jgi:hypothetical protein
MAANVMTPSLSAGNYAAEKPFETRKIQDNFPFDTCTAPYLTFQGMALTPA